MSSIKYENQIIDAIQTIVDNAVENAHYDKTIQASIVKAVDPTIGKYIVKYQDSAFYAYSMSTDVTYAKGTNVYILIPANDMSREKTILGSVDRLGTSYVNETTGENAYQYNGNNIINSSDTFELHSYVLEERVVLYDKEENINKINLNVRDAEEYLKESSTLWLGANFRTNLPKEQRFKGNYGVELEIIYNTENEEEEKIKTYILDVNDINGQPYNLTTETKQYTVFNIENDKFKEIKKLSIFEYGFPNSKEEQKADIFISGIEILGAEPLTSDELSKSTLILTTPKGSYFNDIEIGNKEIFAQIRVKGQNIDNNTQSVKYYWFRENISIDSLSQNYFNLGGKGWECLNEYNIIDLENKLIEWIPANNVLTLKKEEHIAKETQYKCVAVYKDDIILSKVINISNYSSPIDIEIESSNGSQFYFDTGDTILTCKINNEEHKENDYIYSWGVVDINNRFSSLSGDGNKIYIEAKDITNLSVYKCSVSYKGVYQGTASITLKNSLESSDDYTLIINNGVQVFKYDVNGISPASNSLLKPITILPLGIVLYDEQGNEISEDSIPTSAITWKVPLIDTMLKVKDYDREEDGYAIFEGLKELNYDIVSKYNITDLNNSIELSIDYDGRIMKSKTDFTFIKEGNPGTNGTDYICKIVPNTDDLNFRDEPILYYTNGNIHLNYSPRTNNQWFKAELWRDGENLFTGINNGTSEEGKNVFISWEIQNTNRILEKAIAISADGNVTIDKEILSTITKDSNINNIIKVTLTYEGMNYYATLPIKLIYSPMNEINYKIEVKNNSGFNFVVYNENGKNPQYDNSIPFEIKVYENNIEVYDLTSYEFNWEVSNNNIIEKSYMNIKLDKNKKYFKPIDEYNGAEIINNILVTITKNSLLIGKVLIPISFSLNRYGNASINEWDGNSISLNEEGGIILSPQVGAGKKETDNTFTGIFMGTVQENRLADEENGLFGYNHGQRTIYLNTKDGSATFGKTGGGQIIIDPNEDSAILKSGNYNETEKTGMKIDLNEPSIKFGSGNFYVDPDGTLHAKAIDMVKDDLKKTNENITEIDKSIKYFNVYSSTNTILFAAKEYYDKDNDTIYYYPLENSSYSINIISKYKDEDVNITASFDKTIQGITRSFDRTNKKIIFSVDKNKPIQNTDNIFTVTFKYVDSFGNEHTDIQQYSVNLVIKGENGETGTASYTFFRWSPNANGDNMTEVPNENSKYLGIYQTTINQPSVLPSDYIWSLIKGATGASPYFGMLTNENHTFIYGKEKSIETELKGFYGTDEQNVTILSVNGKTPSTINQNIGFTGINFKIDSQNNQKIIFTSTIDLPQSINEQIPITYKIGNNTLIYTTYFSCSSTTKGEDGASAKAVSISASSTYFKKNSDATNYTPDSISLIPYFQGENTYYNKWQYSYNGSDWKDVTSTLKGITISETGILEISNNSFFTDNTNPSITFKCLSNIEPVFDTQTILKVSDGANGSSVSVSSSIAKYMISNDGTTVPTETATKKWSTTIPKTTDAEKYLWCQNTVTYTDGKTAVSYGVSSTMDSLSNFISTTTTNIEELQKQVDGTIMTWFYNYVPLPNSDNPSAIANYPASEWTTDAKKEQHVGDLFYIIDDKEKAGQCFRWAKIEDAYRWIIVEDVDVAKALSDAAKAQDTADGKRRVFVSQPTVPYDVGDLWLKDKELYSCKTARKSGSYTASEWEIATKYTDDTLANQALTEAKKAKTLFISLSNENHSIPTDKDGNNGDYTGANTKIQVFYGNTDVTSLATITPSATNITGSYSNYTYTVTKINADSGYVDFSVEYTPTGLSKITSTARFSLSKTRAGGTGVSARVYEIQTSANTIIKGANGSLNPSSLTFYSYYTDGNSTTKTAYNGTWWIQESINGTTWTDKVAASATNATSKTITPSATTKFIRAYLGPTNTTPTQQNALDVQTVPVLTDISNIEIGGTNLLKGTSGEWEKVYQPSTGTNQTKIYKTFIMPDDVKVGDTFTITCDVKLENFVWTVSSGTYGVYIQGDVDGSWSYTNIFTNGLMTTKKENGIYHCTKKAVVTDATLKNYNIGFRTDNSDGNGIVYIKNCKIETGNQSTAWSPAPGDIDDDIGIVQEGVNEIRDNTVVGTKFQYAITAIGETPNDSTEWKDSYSLTDIDKLVWQRIAVQYAEQDENGNPIWSYSSPGLISETKIVSTITQYYESDSANTKPPANAVWKNEKPINTDKYIWTRTQYNYTHGESKYSTPTCDTLTKRLQENIQNSANKITNGLETGYVKIYNNYIYLLDVEDPEKATQAIQLGKNGIAFAKSKTGSPLGWNSTTNSFNNEQNIFTSVWGINGTFDAQSLNVKNINASEIQDGILELGKTQNVNGQLNIFTTNGSVPTVIADGDGIIVNLDNGGQAKITKSKGLEVTYGDSVVYGSNTNGDAFKAEKIEIQKETVYGNVLRQINMELTTDDKIHHVGIGFLKI